MHPYLQLRLFFFYYYCENLLLKHCIYLFCVDNVPGRERCRSLSPLITCSLHAKSNADSTTAQQRAIV